jgi:uncharacterized membrane protein YhaH (DUF805 family)
MFRGRTDAATFATAAGCVNALFVGITLAFPFLLTGLLSLSGCQSVGGACGALGLVLAIWIKPMIYVAYVSSFLGLAMRRLRDAGLPVALALGLLVLMLGDVQWSIVAGAPWSVAFATGFTGGFPRSLMAGLACVAALSMLPALVPGPGGDGRRTLSAPAVILLGLLMVVAIASLITLLTSMFGGMLAWSRLLNSGPFSLIHTPAQLAVTAAPLVIAALCYREWVARGRPGAGSPWAAAVAVSVVVIAIGSVVGTGLDTWVALAQLLGIRGRWYADTVFFNWMALAELLALFVLPLLLRFMPGAPSSAPVAEEPRQAASADGASQAARVAFGRRSSA